MKTNFLTALRNILKNKANSAITISGLSVAFACLLLIFLFVSQEFRYNNFHEKGDRIYRVNYSVELTDGLKADMIYLEPELSEALKERIPQIERSTAYRSSERPTVVFNNQFFEEELGIAEPDFFNMFSFNFLIGNKDKVFQNPNEVIITSKLADKFQAAGNCSREDLIGKEILFKDTGDKTFYISGILEDIPVNSSIRFDIIIPYEYEDAFRSSNNMFGNSTIFYEVDSNSDPSVAEAQVKSYISEYFSELVGELKNQKILVDSEDGFKPFVLPFTEVYLSNVYSDYERSNSKTSLSILSSIGILILIIACSNFLLLSLGQSYKKTGEIGIRKAIGAKGWNIFSILLTESFVVTVAALLLGTVLCFLLFPVFYRLSQNQIYTEMISFAQVLAFAGGCILLVVIPTSIIPVLKLIKIRPNMLASKSLPTNRKIDISGLFITLQYGLSIVLIILTIAIVKQTNYMKYNNLGFTSENIIKLRTDHLDENKRIVLKEKLIANPAIENLTLTDRDYINGRSSEFVDDKKGGNFLSRILRIDPNYISTLGLNLIQGENFNENSSGNQAVVVNEKLLTFFDFQDEAIGQIISVNNHDYRIQGVVKDYHFDSMKEEIEPLMLFSRTESGANGRYLLIKYNPSQLAGLIPFIEKTWKEVVAAKELDLGFWNEQLNQRYENEDRWSRIIGVAAIITIIISSLGIFGLTLLVINRRVKEVGIRKVNGAKVSEVMALLDKDFIKWVAFAYVLSIPVAWFAMHKWLESFAYKTTLSWWIYALAGILAIGIALLTVSWQSWKAATRNPVEALRYE